MRHSAGRPPGQRFFWRYTTTGAADRDFSLETANVLTSHSLNSQSEQYMSFENQTKIAAFVGDGAVHPTIGTGEEIHAMPLAPATARLLASQLLQAARVVDPQGHADAAMALAQEGVELLAAMQPARGAAKH
jgi:hypothetical protein